MPWHYKRQDMEQAYTLKQAKEGGQKKYSAMSAIKKKHTVHNCID